MFKKLNIFLLILIIHFLVIFVNINIAFAQQDGDGGQDSGTVCIPNPLTGNCDTGGGDSTDPRVIIGQGIKTVLGIIGSVALAVFIYGGFLWLTSGGNETRIKKGKDVILWATLGLVIIFAAYAIVGFFLGGGFLSIFFI